jgi:hypothetical protein
MGTLLCLLNAFAASALMMALSLFAGGPKSQNTTKYTTRQSNIDNELI